MWSYQKIAMTYGFSDNLDTSSYSFKNENSKNTFRFFDKTKPITIIAQLQVTLKVNGDHDLSQLDKIHPFLQ